MTNKVCRIITALFFWCVWFLMGGCSKPAAAQNAPKTDDERNAEIEHLSIVLSGLKERAKNAIPNGDPDEFLSDLHKVIQNDKDDLLVLCDKTHPVGKDYAPPDIIQLEKNPYYNINRAGLSLRKAAADAMAVMGKAACDDGITLLVSSTYRTYEYQTAVYERLVRLEGQETADRESARPGTSQHQLGTVIDFGNIDDSFSDTAPCKWLNANAGAFGWSLSFPNGYEEDTGYRWECWHFRYIGKEACRFQDKWFSGIQQYMLEFIDAWKKSASQ